MSWPGILQREDCADSILIKFYKGDNTNDFGMSEPLNVTTNTYIVRDVVPNLPYTFQVSIVSGVSLYETHITLNTEPGKNALSVCWCWMSAYAIKTFMIFCRKPSLAFCKAL